MAVYKRPSEEEIKRKELKYNWDRVNNRKMLIIRRMLYDNPREVYWEYDREFLKKLFLDNLHLFDKLNRNFWKLALKVSDEEFNRKAKENFRLSCKIWNF